MVALESICDGRGFLIVDDKSFVRLTVQSLLAGMGSRDVLQASNGAEALRTIAAHGNRIECIISDLSMSPINGLELLQAVRSGDVPGARAEMPFLLLTGFAHAAAVKAAAQLDVHGCLTKPISRAQLGSAVDGAFSRQITPKRAAEYAGVLTMVTEIRSPAPDWVLSMAQSQNRDDFIERVRGLRRAVIGAVMANGACADPLRNPRKLGSAALTPGMVIAADVCDPTGRSLLGAGTILSAALIGELGQIARETGREVQVVVGEPSVT